MSKFLVIPDSFKGTLTSREVCEIITTELQKAQFTNVISYNASDGGEGFLESINNITNLEKIFIDITGPDFNRFESFYLYDSLNKIVYIELAKTSGLALTSKNNPLLTTTYGLGEQIKDCLRKEVQHIYIGLGGSSTNDAGLGALCALGIKFLDQDDKNFIPVGGTINNIKEIDYSSLDQRLYKTKITLVCDVVNPLFGLRGTSYTFGPQKGANLAQVITLDNNLRYLHNLLSKMNLKVEDDFPSAGAAGGIPYGFKAFLPVEIYSGSEYFFELINFKKIINGVNYIITGEGRLDETSFSGKLVSKVIELGLKHHQQIVLFVGSIDDNLPKKYLEKIKVYPLTNAYPITDEIIKDSKINLQKAVKKFIDEIK